MWGNRTVGNVVAIVGSFLEGLFVLARGLSADVIVSLLVGLYVSTRSGSI